MKHKKKIKKLGRDKSHRKAMLSNLASSLIISEYVVTTLPKAKACKKMIDKLISVGKQKTKQSHRKLIGTLKDPMVVGKIEDVLVSRFKNRIGGYTKTVRIGKRKGDNAQLMKIFFIDSEIVRKEKKIKVKTKKRKKEQKRESKEKDSEKGVLEKVRSLRERMRSRKDDKTSTQDNRAKTLTKAGAQKTRSGI